MESDLNLIVNYSLLKRQKYAGYMRVFHFKSRGLIFGNFELESLAFWCRMGICVNFIRIFAGFLAYH